MQTMGNQTPTKSDIVKQLLTFGQIKSGINQQ